MEMCDEIVKKNCNRGPSYYSVLLQETFYDSALYNIRKANFTWKFSITPSSQGQVIIYLEGMGKLPVKRKNLCQSPLYFNSITGDPLLHRNFKRWPPKKAPIKFV